jgi:hypothetical protein
MSTFSNENHVTRGFTSDAINEFAFRLFVSSLLSTYICSIRNVTWKTVPLTLNSTPCLNLPHCRYCLYNLSWIYKRYITAQLFNQYSSRNDTDFTASQLQLLHLWISKFKLMLQNFAGCFSFHSHLTFHFIWPIITPFIVLWLGVFKATFNIISSILWQSVKSMEKITLP